MCSTVKNVFVVGEAADKSDLFSSARIEAKDKYNF